MSGLLTRYANQFPCILQELKGLIVYVSIEFYVNDFCGMKVSKDVGKHHRLSQRAEVSHVSEYESGKLSFISLNKFSWTRHHSHSLPRVPHIKS